MITWGFTLNLNRRLRTIRTKSAFLFTCLSIFGCVDDREDKESAKKISISLEPLRADLQIEEHFTFIVLANGIGVTQVRLRVEEANGGTITPDGNYTAPSQAGTFHVIATYKDKTVTAIVTVHALPTSITSLAAGGNHTCGIIGSTLQCWGASGVGQLGVGQVSGDKTTPSEALFSEPISGVSANWDRTCATAKSGAVYCWGLNDLGQSGTGSAEYQLWSPTHLTGLTGAIQVAVSARHACAVTIRRSVYCWGVTNGGALGTSANSEPFPTHVAQISNASQVVVGWDHTCAVLTTGTVECWGDGFYGQLGAGSLITESNYPVQVSGLTSGVIELAAGDDHTCALKNDGSIYCWGLNNHGQFGDGTQLNASYPVQVNGIVSASHIAASIYSTCAIDDGQVKCWGQNLFGVLGTGSDVGPETCDTAECSLSPITVNGIPTPSSISVGLGHACAVSTNGKGYCWGANEFGQLGTGGTSYIAGPSLVRN